MLHREPETRAEKLALHLEIGYGLQLDPVRHKQLVKELEEFLAPVPALKPVPVVIPPVGAKPSA